MQGYVLRMVYYDVDRRYDLCQWGIKKIVINKEDLISVRLGWVRIGDNRTEPNPDILGLSGE